MHRKCAFLIYSEESMEYCNTTDSLLIMLSWVWFVMYFLQRMKLAAREELQVYREKYLMFLDGLSDQERAQLLLQKRAKKETRAHRKHKMVTSFVWLTDRLQLRKLWDCLLVEWLFKQTQSFSNRADSLVTVSVDSEHVCLRYLLTANLCVQACIALRSEKLHDWVDIDIL